MVILSLLSLVFLSNCRTFSRPAVHKSIIENEVYWMNYDATRRGGMIYKDADNKIHFLSEPSPDVAMEITDKYLGKINYKEIQGEASAELAENMILLGKRNSTIMFLRESLFRLNEMTVNGTFTKIEAEKLFKEILKCTLTIAKAELVDANANLLTEAEKLMKLGFKEENLKGFFSAPQK